MIDKIVQASTIAKNIAVSFFAINTGAIAYSILFEGIVIKKD